MKWYTMHIYWKTHTIGSIISHSTSVAGLVIIVNKKWPINSKLYKELQKAKNIQENLEKGNAVRFTPNIKTCLNVYWLRHCSTGVQIDKYTNRKPGSIKN